MTSVTDIRPTIAPVSLTTALEGIDIQGFYGADGSLARIAESPLSLRGVTVSSDDCEAEWLFVAIPGLKQHGIRFAHAAIEAGASVVLTDEEGRTQAFERSLGVPVVQVADPRAVVPQLCANIYASPASRLTTMAVTGTNGKTTTSYLMRAAIASQFPNASLCGTVETHVGPISFESVRTTAEAPVIARFLAATEQYGCGAGVIELSAHALSLHRVDGIVFDVAAFTNLQHDHLDYYGDMENYFQAKALLFTPEHSRHGVVCVDDEWGRRLAQQATVPVIETGAGVCHVYVDKSANVQMAADIIENAKTTRPSVCNAAECMLLHRDIAAAALPVIAERLQKKHTVIRGDARVQAILKNACEAATQDDWGREYGDYIIAARVVDSLDEAVDYIYQYSTGHSECIVTDDAAAAAEFMRRVDAAAVYHNASTRFTDGGEFGLGAEIGISTQKLHARGPLGLRELTSMKYEIFGSGQIR